MGALYKFIGCLLLSLMLLGGAHAANDQADVIVVNSYEWQDLYLGTIYAGQIGARIVHFQNLGDAQIKTKSIDIDADIYVLESKRRPVVKNYKKFLSVSDYTSFDAQEFTNYRELQELLFFDEPSSKYFLLDPRFGVESVTAAPLILRDDYTPVFIDSENRDDVFNMVKDAADVTAAGYFPIRVIEGFSGNLMTGTSFENAKALSNQYVSTGRYDWGVITRIDGVDLVSLTQGNPIFAYTGDSDETAEIIKESKIEKFEVIGANMADIAKAIEASTGEDLKYLLKYARTVTGIEGLRGEVLDIDTVFFDFPFPSMEFLGVDYYADQQLLALTYENNGNIPTSVFSNVEFSQNALTDQFIYVVPVGSKIVIPHYIEFLGPDVISTVVNTRYGIGSELTQSILGESGLPVINTEAGEKTAGENITAAVVKAELDTKRGVVVVHAENTHSRPINAMAMLIYNGTQSEGEVLALLSPVTALPSGNVGEMNISVPYISNDELLLQEYEFRVLSGPEETLFVHDAIVLIEQRVEKNDMTIIYIGLAVSVVVLLLLIVVFFLLRSKKSSKKSVSVSVAKKPSARKRVRRK